MYSHALEWMNLAISWIHVIVGVAWIGASFYFVWLENNLERKKKDLPDRIAGDLWAIHGGGIYYLQKFKVSPKEMPETLHWFKWEAYATWITGFALLIVVYYMNAKAMMVDPTVADITFADPIAIGLLSLVIGWFFYDVLCKTPVLKKPVLMLIVMFGFLTLSAWLLTQVLAPRAAYIHVGAMIGTMMAGNVLFVIIPNQKRLVAAAEKGEEPDPWLGEYAGLRSRHNNYFTLPVLFIMVSNHFPTTYQGTSGWLTLAALSAVALLVRHHFNVRHHTNSWAWTIPFAVVAIFVIAYFATPKPPKPLSKEELLATPVSFAEVQEIVGTRCATCHSRTPSDDVYKAPPAGLMLDTGRQIKENAYKIYERAYLLQNMPQANKTEITDVERTKLGAWYEQGAPGQ